MTPITDELIRSITERIAQEIHPDKIFLFGSRAWGEPHESSDIDLFIVVPHSDEPAYRRARSVYRCLRGLNVPVDIVVQTCDEVERSRNVVTSLARKVLEEGRVLYG